jgi:VanZ family protein
MAFLQKIAQVAGWLAVVVIAILSMVPGSLRPDTGAPPKLEHVAAYLVAAGLLTFGYGKQRHPLVVALCLSIYSAALEIAQILIPGRHAGFSDFAASATGAVIGSALAWIVLRALPRDFA